MQILILLTCLFTSTCSSCENPLVELTSGFGVTSFADEIDNYENWNEETHSSDDAHYDLVFNDTVVHRIDITIDNSNYQIMEDDMESLYGVFGGSFRPRSIIIDDPVYVPVTVTHDGTEWQYVGMRYKGNSSLRDSWTSGNHKLPFRLDFDKYDEIYPQTEGQNFYGFEELTFSNGKNDYSLIRDMMASVLFSEAGLPAAKAAFYRIFIDVGDGNGSVYWGLYTMIEDPSDVMLTAQFSDGSGNLYKPDNETYSTLSFFDAEYYDKKTNKDEADWSDMENFINIINAVDMSDDDWRTAMENVFRVQDYLKYLAVNNTIQNWDVYGSKAHNYYLYADPSDNGRFIWIPWDMNEALTSDPKCLSFSMAEISGNWPLIRNIMDQPEYEDFYEQSLFVFFTAEDAVFNPETIITKMEFYSALIEDYVIGDEYGEITGYTWLSDDLDFFTALDDLKEHISSRFIAVESYLAAQ